MKHPDSELLATIRRRVEAGDYPSWHAVVRSADGRAFLDLTPAQLLLALDGARPQTLGRVNAYARAWAKAQGYAGSHGWTKADLVREGLAVPTLRASRARGRGAWRWLV